MMAGLRLLLLQVALCAADGKLDVAFPNGTGTTATFAPFLLTKTAVIPGTFLSFNFDWNLNGTPGDSWTNASVGWTLDLQNPKLLTLAKALSPANLRVGGSSADAAEYGGFPGGTECSNVTLQGHVCLTPARWDELIGFAHKAGLRLVFDLNIMFGRGDDLSHPWDPSNVRSLLAYTAKKYPVFDGGFELGNEKEYALGPVDTAQCFLKVRAMIEEFWPGQDDKPILVGPAMNVRPDWLHQFLDALGRPGVVDAISYHMYAGYGRSTNLPDLIMQPGWLDFTHQYMAANERSRLASIGGQGAELWIGETAAAWASGTAGVCDGFISGFWWLDQLGMAATTGHGAMCRQCLVGGNYSLIDQLNGFAPNPDYWSALLWRQLMGVEMLQISQVMPYEGDYKPKVRAYMACTSPLAHDYKDGAVTMVFINQDETSNQSIVMYQQARFAATSPENTAQRLGDEEWPPTPPTFANLPRVEYVLTAPGGNLLSRTVELNGDLLQFGADGALPAIRGRAGEGLKFLVPPKSYGMAVYPNANAPACRKSASPQSSTAVV